MNLGDIQKILAVRHVYDGPIDGEMGPQTKAALIKLIADAGVNARAWPDSRITIAAIQVLAREVKIDTGAVDGFAGPQTRYAIEVYDARLKNNGKPVRAVEKWRDDAKAPQATPTRPLPPPITSSQVNAPATRPKWPLQRASAMDAFFGSRGSNWVSLRLPFKMRFAWDPTHIIGEFDCNKKIHESLDRIFVRTLDYYGIDAIREMRLDRWGGCGNVRKMRGGSAWSIHSWGCAVDIDPDRNPLKARRAQATLDNPEYDPFWRFVYDEGALGLGRERDYDWMHFQFARL
jgi:hypothetical protein